MPAPRLPGPETARMLHSSYNRAPRRKLIPNLFSSILQVIADSEHPLTEPEIVAAISRRMNRNDEELKRQITVGLQDALITGYLRIKNLRYSVISNRLEQLQSHGGSSSSGIARASWTSNGSNISRESLEYGDPSGGTTSESE
ncbi:uncharacterized protein LOC110181966 [Drosophila serrata]|uniref:uncharacterized protein LOC110181966 n=1 Tax=Drosophila serrata TaxID=7274 RepID=UPI000A1D26E4|nr:uncharacterized protein LOC110181966 [Drosophila serrata]